MFSESIHSINIQMMKKGISQVFSKPFPNFWPKFKGRIILPQGGLTLSFWRAATPEDTTSQMHHPLKTLDRFRSRLTAAGISLLPSLRQINFVVSIAERILADHVPSSESICHGMLTEQLLSLLIGNRLTSMSSNNFSKKQKGFCFGQRS